MKSAVRELLTGRIVVTTSGSGTVGNFGQSNYGAAKMAVNGVINVLRLEGAKYNILCNAISPSARTRMTEALLPPHMQQYMRPEFVSPAVAWLCAMPTARSSRRLPGTMRGCSISSPKACSSTRTSR
jgi:NAD(P)-dependent dehydrogenase (short-subunit alcohol dehydrogenase family)